MSVTLLSVFVVSVFITILCIEIHSGAERGFHLSLISLGAVILSLFLAFPLTSLASSAIASQLMSYAEEMDIYRQYEKLLPSIRSVLLNLLAMLIGTILFIFVFLILLKIVRMIVFAVYRKRAAKHLSASDRLSRARGAICGFLSAVILTLTLTAPIMGTLELADKGLYILKQTSTSAYQAIGSSNAAMVHSYTEDVSGNVFYQNGGRLIYNSASGVYVSGKRVYLLTELETISGMSKDMLDVYRIFLNPQMATDDHTQALRRLSADVQELVLLEDLVTDIIKQCSLAWQKDEAFLTIRSPKMNGVLKPMFLEILDVCANTNFTNAKQNASTLLEAYAVILESGIYQEDPNDHRKIMNALQSDGTIRKLEKVLSENPSMENVSSSSIAVASFAACVKMDTDSDRQARLCEDIALIISSVNGRGGSESEKVEAMTSLFQEAMKAEGFLINKTFSEYISGQLLKELPGKNVSEDDVSRLFDRYLQRMK